jgi:hypothetical protein
MGYSDEELMRRMEATCRAGKEKEVVRKFGPLFIDEYRHYMKIIEFLESVNEREPSKNSKIEKR